MKKIIALLGIVGTIALSGCTSSSVIPAAPSLAAHGPTSEPTESAATQFVVSEAATCVMLVGVDEKGPLIQYVNKIVKVDVDDTAAMDELREIKEQISATGKRSTPEMQLLIEALFSSDVNDFKASGTELLTRCG